MRRVHEMPFGSRVLAAGGVRFAFWAPGARAVEIELEIAGSAPSRRTMTPVDSGWFEAVCQDASAGTRYRFVLEDGLQVPDPASRCNPGDVHGASEVLDPAAFPWDDGAWAGRPWEEVVLYELHVGTFSPEGTFAGVERRLDHLQALGITAIELMPIADFPGRRNWGYDGVLPFAPDASYGRPEDLKRLVQAAHARGIMVFLDVAYNHFGPEGNYLHAYAAPFFTSRYGTPWGAAIDFDGPRSGTVRDFFVHNALFWVKEYGIDGLRLDAAHAIFDASRPDILEEIARAVRAGPGRTRHVHLVLENDHNAAHYLGTRPAEHGRYDAQWNDDLHHALHVILTGERDGYYADYADRPLVHLARCLAEGFAYQGEVSAYRGGHTRGERSAHLRPTAFVSFLRNHDQVGNRALGDRIVTQAAPEALRAAMAILLLAPQTPLLFMGEEWGAREPFAFFCDFEPGLAVKVSDGRRREFARFAQFSTEEARRLIPDPGRREAFDAARLAWDALLRPDHAAWLDFYRRLLDIRRREVVPHLAGAAGGAVFAVQEPHVLTVQWPLSAGARLHLLANLGPAAVRRQAPPAGHLLFATSGADGETPHSGADLRPWAVEWSLETRHE